LLEKSSSFSSSDDFLIVKLNSSGNIQWAKTIGGLGGDFGFSIQQTSDGGYIVAGFSYSIDFSSSLSDFLIAKLNSSGNIESCSNISDVTPLISNNDVTSSISNNDVSSSLSINDVSSTINQNDVSSSLTINDVSPTENNICPSGGDM
jgi:hypothetical protein